MLYKIIEKERTELIFDRYGMPVGTARLISVPLYIED